MKFAARLATLTFGAPRSVSPTISVFLTFGLFNTLPAPNFGTGNVSLLPSADGKNFTIPKESFHAAPCAAFHCVRRRERHELTGGARHELLPAAICRGQRCYTVSSVVPALSSSVKSP